MKATLALFYRDMKIWTRRPAVPFLTLISPLVYFLIFGPTLTTLVSPIRLGELSVKYIVFITPGILAILIFSTSVMSSITTLFLDRRSGMFEFLMGCPVSKQAYVLARFMASITQTMLLTSLFLLLGYGVLGFPLSLAGLLTFFAGVTLGTLFFSSLMLIIVTKITDQDTFNALMSFSMPLLIFASWAFYPIQLLPGPLATVAMINPLTYVIEILRAGILNAFTDSTIIVISFFAAVTLALCFASIRAFLRAEMVR